MSRWVNQVERDTYERRKRGKVHSHLPVHDHCFMPDRVYIDVHIASQKMFRLRIIGATEHLLNEDLPSACCSEQPKKAAHQQCDRQKTRPGASRLA